MNTVFDSPDRRRFLREIDDILSVLECRLIATGLLRRRDSWGWNDRGEWRKGEDR